MRLRRPMSIGWGPDGGAQSHSRGGAVGACLPDLFGERPSLSLIKLFAAADSLQLGAARRASQMRGKSLNAPPMPPTGEAIRSTRAHPLIDSDTPRTRTHTPQIDMRFAGSALALAATAATLLASPSEAALGTNKNAQQQTKAKQQYKTDPCKFVDCPPLNPKLSVKHDVMVRQKGTATLSLTNTCGAENVVAQIVVPAGIKILSTSSKSGVQATVGALSATTGGNVVWKLPKQKSYKVRACPIESIGCGHWVGEARGLTESAAAPATEFEQRNTRIEPTPPPTHSIPTAHGQVRGLQLRRPPRPVDGRRRADEPHHGHAQLPAARRFHHAAGDAPHQEGCRHHLRAHAGAYGQRRPALRRRAPE